MNAVFYVDEDEQLMKLVDDLNQVIHGPIEQSRVIRLTIGEETLADLVRRILDASGVVYQRSYDGFVTVRTEKEVDGILAAKVVVAPRVASPMELAEEPHPLPLSEAERGVGKRCKNCGAPVARQGAYCNKKECKRVYNRLWWQENKGQYKKAAGSKGQAKESSSKHVPFGQAGEGAEQEVPAGDPEAAEQEIPGEREVPEGHGMPRPGEGE